MLPILGIISTLVISLLFWDWHARAVFVATGYPRRYGHGNSGNRARKHYKSNWTFLQRLIWIPVFMEWYESKYRIMAYMSYVHYALTAIAIAGFLIDELLLDNITFWHYIYAIYLLFLFIRFIYTNAIGRRKI